MRGCEDGRTGGHRADFAGDWAKPVEAIDVAARGMSS